MDNVWIASHLIMLHIFSNMEQNQLLLLCAGLALQTYLTIAYTLKKAGLTAVPHTKIMLAESEIILDDNDIHTLGDEEFKIYTQLKTHCQSITIIYHL